MKKSFYHFLATKRNADSRNDLAIFAENVYDDIAFPKQSEDFQEISHYLELNGEYVTSMSIFDEAWACYLAEAKD